MVEQVLARCTREEAAALVGYDHHRVKVGGRWGILITYHWMPLEEAQEPLVVKVVFNPSPKHLPTEEAARKMVFQHPLAPADVQEMIDGLKFE